MQCVHVDSCFCKKLFDVMHINTKCLRVVCCQTWPWGYNLAKHEILNADKYKNIKKFSFIQAQISLECYFSCS